MSKFSKVFSLVLALVMSFSAFTGVFAYTVADDVAGTVYEEAAATLGALNIMIGDDTGKFRPDDKVTRAEFAKIAVCALGLEEVAASSQGVSTFPDVPVEYWANGFINVAASAGIVIGDDTGKFRPSDGISYQEAVTILVRLLGYEPVAKSKGGYPTGYIVVGNDIGLTKKATMGAQEVTTRGITAQMTFNALTINLMEAVGYGDSITYEIVDKTVLKDKLDTEKKTGVVTANSLTALSGTTSLNEGQVQIDNKDIYYTGKSNISHLLGQFVTYYVKTDENDDKTVILAQSDSNKNKIVTIDAQDLAGTITAGATSISYYPDIDADPVELTLADSYNVIYNDRHTASLSHPATGSVTLIDSTRDNKYDTVFINEYTTYVVEETSSASKKIFEKYGKTALDLNTDKNKDLKISIEDKDGFEVKFEDIKEWDVLSVYRNTNYLKIVVSKEFVTGVITERSEREEIVVIGDVEYELAENMNISDLKLDLEGTFYLDMTGKIGAYNANLRNATKYAYLINAGTTGTFNTTLDIQLFTAEGEFVTLKAAEKFKIDETTGFTASTGLTELLGGGSTVTPQIVTYEVNANKEITVIDRAADKTASFPNSFVKNAFALNFKGTGLIYKAASGKLNIVDGSGNTTGTIGIGDNTVILSIANGETDEDNMEVCTKSIFSDLSSYDVEIYDLSEDMTAGLIRITNVVSSNNLDSDIAVVTKITSSTNSDGNRIDKLYAMVGGKEVIINTEDDTVLRKEGTTKLEAGDIIQYTLNAKGEIDGFTLLFEGSKKGTEFTKTYGSNKEMTTVYGKVTSKFSDSINVSVNAGAAVNYSLKDVTVMKFDSSKNNNKVTAATTGDIAKWETGANEQRVFLRIYKDEVKEIVIVE